MLPKIRASRCLGHISTKLLSQTLLGRIMLDAVESMTNKRGSELLTLIKEELVYRYQQTEYPSPERVVDWVKLKAKERGE